MASIYDWIRCPHCEEEEQAYVQGADDGSIGFYCEACGASDWQ